MSNMIKIRHLNHYFYIPGYLSFYARVYLLHYQGDTEQVEAKLGLIYFKTTLPYLRHQVIAAFPPRKYLRSSILYANKIVFNEFLSKSQFSNQSI